LYFIAILSANHGRRLRRARHAAIAGQGLINLVAGIVVLFVAVLVVRVLLELAW